MERYFPPPDDKGDPARALHHCSVHGPQDYSVGGLQAKGPARDPGGPMVPGRGNPAGFLLLRNIPIDDDKLRGLGGPVWTAARFKQHRLVGSLSSAVTSFDHCHYCSRTSCIT